MSNKEILEKIKNLSNQEKRNLNYEELIEIINKLTPNEIIELSNIIGYPVFTRLCMGVLKHKFVLLQDGAAAIIVNEISGRQIMKLFIMTVELASLTLVMKNTPSNF